MLDEIGALIEKGDPDVTPRVVEKTSSTLPDRWRVRNASIAPGKEHASSELDLLGTRLDCLTWAGGRRTCVRVLFDKTWILDFFSIDTFGI